MYCKICTVTWTIFLTAVIVLNQVYVCSFIPYSFYMPRIVFVLQQDELFYSLFSSLYRTFFPMVFDLLAGFLFLIKPTFLDGI